MMDDCAINGFSLRVVDGVLFFLLSLLSDVL